MSFLDNIVQSGAASDLATTNTPVNVSSSTPPHAGDVLTAVDSTHATWQPPSGGGGGGDGGNAGGLETTGAPVDVSGSAPPVAGQVLMATDAEHATWRVPGLHYDPSIKFWTASVGSATIEPGTWGFIEQAAGSTTPIVVSIVSSLDAPPVDSRFGLYVGRDVTVPVSVNVIGASQIQGLDGLLGPSTALLPGSDYEWVFYHEDESALWGLVSDTAGVAKRLRYSGGTIEIASADPPISGSVLTAIDAEHAQWLPPVSPAGSGLVYVSGTSPDFGQWVIAASGVDPALPTPTAIGQRVGVYVPLNVDGVSATNADAPIYLNRNAFTPSANLLPGGWYEWASISTGEGFAWVPHGGSGHESTPPLEESLIPGLGIWPNQWVMSSTAGGVVNMPANPINGDSFGVFVTTPTAGLVPATGQAVISPDGTTTVSAPSSLTLAGPSYYEWIWIDSTAQWNPKSVRSNAGAGLVRTGTTLAVGANADGSIVVNADDIRVGVLATDAQHGDRGGGSQHATAVAGGAAGFLSGADQTKLNSLDPNVITSLYAWPAWKLPCRLCATASLPLSGLAAIDSTAVNAGDRILAPFQSTATQCGIYIAASGAWTRAPDFDASAKIISGLQVAVMTGTTYADSVWTLTSPEGQPVLGTSNIQFTRSDTRGSSPAVNPTAIVPVLSGSTGNTGRWADQSHQHSFPALDTSQNGYRLSTSAGSPVASDGTFSTIFTAAYRGTKISLYNGTNWFVCDFGSGPSLGISGMTAGIPADVFAVFSGLTSWSLELTAWASASVRATGLVLLDGVWVKSGATTRRYLGTILPDSATTFTHSSNPASGTKAVCGIWNQDNRVRSSFNWAPNFSVATPSAPNAWELLGAIPAPHVELVIGQGIDTLNAQAIGAANTGASTDCNIGIGIDSSTSVSGFQHIVSNTSGYIGLTATANQRPAVGRKTVNFLWRTTNTATALFAGAKPPYQAGLSVDFWH